MDSTNTQSAKYIILTEGAIMTLLSNKPHLLPPRDPSKKCKLCGTSLYDRCASAVRTMGVKALVNEARSFFLIPKTTKIDIQAFGIAKKDIHT